MRIAFHVTRASYLRPGLSGDKVFIQCLLASQRERGHEVEIVSRLSIQGVWKGDTSVWRVLREAIAVRRAMRKFDPDAWLVYGASVRTADVFGWWQRPRRYVLLYADADSGDSLPWRWRWPMRFAHRRALARADKIAAWRPKGVDLLRQFGVPESRCVILPYAVRTWDRVPGRQEARQRLNLPETAPLVLCVSRLTAPRADGKPWKTEWVLGLLDVMAELPEEIHLVIVGDGNGRSRVKEGADRRGLQDRVHMVGPVTHDELCQYYAACDLSAALAPTERVFNTILESQGCGCPVVVLRNRATELAVEHDRTGLLAKDPAEFAAHVAAIALDPARRGAMGRAGARFIAEHHSMEVRVAQIEDMLRGPSGGERPGEGSSSKS